MGQVLYRKYRPKSLDDVIGQDHIVKVLSNALSSGKISHAYLFTGPRGVGKTSVARILAHNINNLPYKEDASHIDIIEIDAASNRRIDEIRDLREKVNISPAEAKYKVYIIDEVHMLTKEAFNALLKTLEEPPKHVVFILATTDAHKLPETIISRTQRHNFKTLDTPTLSKSLTSIAKKEKIKIDEETANAIASHGNGSFRDSLSLLDQLASGSDGDDVLKADFVREIAGQPSDTQISVIVGDLLTNQGASRLINDLDQVYQEGAVPGEIAKSVSKALRQKLADQETTVSQAVVGLLEDLLLTTTSSFPQAHLENSFLKYLAATAHVSDEVATEINAGTEIKSSTPEAAKIVTALPKAVSTTSKDQSTNRSGVADQLDESLWTLILENLKTKHNTLYGVIRMANPRFESDKVTLVFEFSFHQKRASEKANYEKLTKVIKEVHGKPIKIEAVIEAKEKTPAIPDPKNRSVETISNIFEGAELLES